MTDRDESFCAALTACLARPEQGPLLGEGTVAALESFSPLAQLSPALRRSLGAVLERAITDQSFTSTARGRPSLGGYVAFLRIRAGLTLTEAAARIRMPFQTLADLERDGVPTAAISPSALAGLVRRLKGSLPMTEALILALPGPPRRAGADRPSRLYRAPHGAAVADTASRAAHGEEGTEWSREYAEERAAAEALAAAFGEAWARRK